MNSDFCVKGSAGVLKSCVFFKAGFGAFVYLDCLTILCKCCSEAKKLEHL